jgi:hypothetical protein
MALGLVCLEWLRRTGVLARRTEMRSRHSKMQFTSSITSMAWSENANSLPANGIASDRKRDLAARQSRVCTECAYLDVLKAHLMPPKCQLVTT